MTKYRIVCETEKSGKNWYYIQEKYLFFWKDLNQVYDMSMRCQRVCFHSFDSANEFLKNQVKFDKEKRQKKIVSKIIIQWP